MRCSSKGQNTGLRMRPACLSELGPVASLLKMAVAPNGKHMHTQQPAISSVEIRPSVRLPPGCGLEWPGWAVVAAPAPHDDSRIPPLYWSLVAMYL